MAFSWLCNIIGLCLAMIGLFQMSEPRFLPTNVVFSSFLSRNEHRAGGLVIALFGFCILSTSWGQILHSQSIEEMAAWLWGLLCALILAVVAFVVIAAVVRFGIFAFRGETRRLLCCGGIHSHSSKVPSRKQTRAEEIFFAIALVGLLSIPIALAMRRVGG